MRITLRPPAAVLAALIVAAPLGAAGCSESNPSSGSSAHSSALDAGGASSSSLSSSAAEPAPIVDLPWGPTSADVSQARELIAGWDADRLAGQLIVGRFAGTDPAAAADLVTRLHLAGMSVQGSNVADEAQVRALTSAITVAAQSDGRAFPAIIGVDQEGGDVEHLRGIATEFPSFSAAGDELAVNPDGGAAVIAEAARTTGLELRGFGFTWAFAPVADVTAGPGDVAIGNRSPSGDPQIAAAAVAAAVDGYRAAGIVGTPKHFPGHGSANGDSHLALPAVTRTLPELQSVDLVPFARAIESGANAIMIGHLDVAAIAPGTPSTLAPQVYSMLRDSMGFSGITITDSMGMGAVTSRPEQEVAALLAGADLVLMPADTQAAHASIVAAITAGTLPRERVLDSVARVIALQMWQARVGAANPVPADIATQAAAAAAALGY